GGVALLPEGGDASADGRVPLLTGVDKVRFRRPVVPGGSAAHRGDGPQGAQRLGQGGRAGRRGRRARGRGRAYVCVEAAVTMGGGPRIHPTAVVDSGARIADDVVIGPYAVVEGDV